MKAKTKYVCQACGYVAAGWLGRCPECEAWNTLEAQSQRESSKSARSSRSSQEDAGRGPLPVRQIENYAVARMDLKMEELNRVLGGGLVPGTVVLLAGDPGIGKSTLLLQAAAQASQEWSKVWYITGEESVQQVKLRAARMGCEQEQLSLWAQTDVEAITAWMEKEKPSLVIVDSIQTMYLPELDNVPGSVTQIRECTARLAQTAKSLHIPVVIVGHVTKDGSIAGPRILEHMVDTVLYFEGERHYPYRILRGVKNRFGSTFEIGVFEMSDQGLNQVLNPSLAFLAQRPRQAPGSVVAACMEGTRPLLVEVQALVSPSSLAQPRRVVTGADYNRVNLILAVLEKRLGMKLSCLDVYVNIVGGLRIQEPAMDLALAVALASSLKNKPLQEGLVVFGEVGLAGELRPVHYPDKRIQEGQKLGMKGVLMPRRTQGKEKTSQIEIREAATLVDALGLALN